MTRVDLINAILIWLPILITLLLRLRVAQKKQAEPENLPINRFVFYFSKISMVSIWFFHALATIYQPLRSEFPLLFQDYTPEVQKLMAAVFLLGANLLLLPAYYSFKGNLKVGIPINTHTLITTGVLQISRNPVYTSFLFFGVAAILYIPSFLILLLTLAVTIIHHFIIRAEEKFLKNTFGSQYQAYRKNVGRYL